MPDRRASLEGTLGRSRHRSPASDQPPDLLESLATGSAVQPAAPILRRRPQRLKSIYNEPLRPTSPTWVDPIKGESRKAPRKASAGSSPISPKTSVGELEPQERERDTIVYFPKLSRIPEGKESKNQRHRRSSTASPTEDCTPARRRRRAVEDATLARRPIRQKHGSLHRRAESLANLPNPSLISVLSGITQHSNASSGSNSTITQQSYNKTHVSKRRPMKERKRLQAKSVHPKAKIMDPPQSSVFQYMNEGLGSQQFLNGDAHDGRPSSSSSACSSESTSSHDTEHDDGQSSNAEEPLDESPMTSPASTRRPDHEETHYHERSSNGSGMSVRESSPGSVHLASENYHIEEEDGDEDDEEDEQEEEEEESQSEDEDGDNNAYSADGHDDNPVHAHHFAMERVPPPRIPSSSSSRHSDPHTRRMRTQEQELRDHVLQSPQPHRDFQFVGGPSPHPASAMPLYDGQPHTDASPVNFYAPAPYPSGWPPQAPPPAAIGYPPHVPPAPYAPGAENNSGVASQYPMAAPNTAVLPPFHHALQPPHYQSQPIGPDLTKTTVVGYELLADKLTELSKNEDDVAGQNKVVPMYRKFEQLNHRVLLHLQDEISELEEELRQLDECIAQGSPRSDTGHVYPASRRGEARYGGELHYKRTDLLGRIYLKLGQYNQALSSYSNMLRNLDAPTTADIHAYHDWMEKHAPIDRNEARFLERKTDLLAVSRRRSAMAVGGVGPQQSAAIGLPLILILPLMAFAVVPGLLGRLFIVILIGAAELMLVTSTELIELMAVKEWVACSCV
ncbi:hypothetical protein K505DRAFT_160845 [Melanomma pulvis-pyrius CBS 109.77]|uniref:DUF6594 domain-containing protein n=1 Tax=Melanomma pulvis-pyrius CBS 109.77 TaxID=1314802 RepID=A0A6A6XKG4_9PLEO|nr:hypothetical protein K505DRAFT_160845 [Melanomma pulvis-pyrius CBS 109.77]